MFNFKIVLAIVIAGILWTVNIDLHSNKEQNQSVEVKSAVQ